ncbi:MAG: GGDEF domain-containing protein [Zoogloeaceae bacterium]|nr:GGDEF domain-containing protein [Zoogloeaceae bacterium]
MTPQAHSLPVLSHYWQRALNTLSGELQRSEYIYLFNPFRHPSFLTSKRIAIIVGRARLIALLFGILTPLWIIVDYFTFSYQLWFSMALLRIGISLSFLALASFHKQRSCLRHAWQILFLLFLIPVLFYIGSHYLLARFPEQAFTTLMEGYSFLPYILMTILAVFPLCILENLFLSLLILSGEFVFILLQDNGSMFYMLNHAGALWLLLLLSCISTTAGSSQLAFMIMLVQQAVRDPLTGSLTRRSGEELLLLQFSLSLRDKTPLTLAFIDLDRFKSVNDQFGHESGDIVLKTAAHSICRPLRGTDVLIRWGGEEFVVIMPNTNTQQAELALERIRKNGLGQRPDGKILTASIGVAERILDNAADSRRLVEIADQRMYQAKQSGRNQIVCSGDDLLGHA